MATRLIVVCFLSAVVWWGGVFALYFFPVPVAACTAIIWTSISIYSSMLSAIEDSAAADDEESKDGKDSKDGDKGPEPESKFLDLLAVWLGPREPPPEGVRAAEDLWPPLPPGFRYDLPTPLPRNCLPRVLTYIDLPAAGWTWHLQHDREAAILSRELGKQHTHNRHVQTQCTTQYITSPQT